MACIHERSIGPVQSRPAQSEGKPAPRDESKPGHKVRRKSRVAFEGGPFAYDGGSTHLSNGLSLHGLSIHEAAGLRAQDLEADDDELFAMCGFGDDFEDLNAFALDADEPLSSQIARKEQTSDDGTEISCTAVDAAVLSFQLSFEIHPSTTTNCQSMDVKHPASAPKATACGDPEAMIQAEHPLNPTARGSWDALVELPSILAATPEIIVKPELAGVLLCNLHADRAAALTIQVRRTHRSTQNPRPWCNLGPQLAAALTAVAWHALKPLSDRL